MKPSKYTEPINDLREHMKKLNKTPRLLDLEFMFIEKQSMDKSYNPPCTVAQLPLNVDKNRWPDVLPPDDNRVKLVCPPDLECSDYINANFIKGNSGENSYISTQGPLENTIIDFWRLCWDHQISVFVMLTREREKEQEKSARYWPEETDNEKKVVHGDIEIILEDKVIDSDLITRTFKFKNTKKPESGERKMWHFQYTGWPDHGIPPSPKHFLQLMQLVDNAVATNNGPIGIHCSAGIGRTGTFLTVHLNVHVLREHFKTNYEPPPINIIKTILDLRKQRPGMVQTKEQFVFCYRAIYDEYMRLWKDARTRKKEKEAEERAKEEQDAGDEEDLYTPVLTYNKNPAPINKETVNTEKGSSATTAENDNGTQKSTVSKTDGLQKPANSSNSEGTHTKPDGINHEGYSHTKQDTNFNPAPVPNTTQEKKE